MYMRQRRWSSLTVNPAGIAPHPYDRAPWGVIGYGGYRRPFKDLTGLGAESASGSSILLLGGLLVAGAVLFDYISKGRR